MRDRDTYREDTENELGYSYASEREVKLREWQDTREDAEFEALCRRLIQTKHNRKRWQRALVDPEFKAHLDEMKRAYARKPSVRARHAEALRRWRARERAKARGEVFTCADCGARWCRIARGGPRPRYCSDACRQHHRWRGLNPGAKTIRRRGYRSARRKTAAPSREETR